MAHEIGDPAHDHVVGATEEKRLVGGKDCRVVVREEKDLAGDRDAALLEAKRYRVDGARIEGLGEKDGDHRAAIHIDGLIRRSDLDNRRWIDV